MLFNVGDKIVLTESSMQSIMKVYGYNDDAANRVMEVAKVNNNGSYVINLKLNVNRIIPFKSTHYRLATDNEIKRDKIKKMFIGC